MLLLFVLDWYVVSLSLVFQERPIVSAQWVCECVYLQWIKCIFLVIKWSTVLHMSSYTLCCDDKSNLSRLHLLHYYHQRLYKNTVKTWNSAQGRERGVTCLGGGGRSKDDNMWCGEQGAKIWLARSYQHCDNILKQCCDKYCHSIIPCSQIHVVTMLLAILFHHFSNIFIILPQYFCVCWEPLSLWPKS